MMFVFAESEMRMEHLTMMSVASLSARAHSVSEGESTQQATHTSAGDDVAPSSRAALHVLTDPTLFRQVAACMCGIPFLLLELEKTLPKDEWSSYHGSNAMVARAAIQRNDRRVLQMLYDVHMSVRKDLISDALRFDDALFWTVKIGRLETLTWMVDTLSELPKASATTLDVAMKRGDVEILEFLQTHFHQHIDRDDASSCALAFAPRQHWLEVAKWLHKHNYAVCFSAYVVERVVESGDIEMLKFLHENRPRSFPSHAIYMTAIGGNRVQHAQQLRPDPRGTRAMDAAAQNGHLEVVRFLHGIRRESCTVLAMDRAACNGFLEIVQFLHANRAEGCTKNALNGAARYGHFDVVRFLVEHRSEGVLDEALHRAESQGHEEVAAYLRGKIEDKVREASL